MRVTIHNAYSHVSTLLCNRIRFNVYRKTLYYIKQNESNEYTRILGDDESLVITEK